MILSEKTIVFKNLVDTYNFIFLHTLIWLERNPISIVNYSSHGNQHHSSLKNFALGDIASQVLILLIIIVFHQETEIQLN